MKGCHNAEIHLIARARCLLFVGTLMPRSNYRGRVLRDVFQGLYFIQGVTWQADSGLLRQERVLQGSADRGRDVTRHTWTSMLMVGSWLHDAPTSV